MKHWRPHRFVPLGELMGTAEWRSGMPLHLAPQMHAALAEGFQQGMDRGYGAGHESGLRAGRESGIEQGREEGRRQGAEAARREALARVESLRAPLDAMLESLRNLQADYQAALHREVVELVARVARQVIRCELALQPQQLLALVDETLATMPRAPGGAIEVHLNEEDLERLLAADPDCATRWNLLADAHLESGECRVRSGNREADAGCRQRLAGCMEQISTQLLPASDTLEAAA